MVSFLAITGITIVYPAQELALNGPVQRTPDIVLRELALLHPAPDAVQKNFFGRAGDHIRTASVYSAHIAKYPCVAAGLCLPFVMKCKNDIFGGIGNSIDWLVYGAVGTAAVAGLYCGPTDARKQLEVEKTVQEYPRAQTMLNAAAAKVAGLENIHGVLGQVKANLAGLTRGCDQALVQLNELQGTARRTQLQLDQANAQLNDVVKKQQEAKALALIQTLREAIKDTSAQWRLFHALELERAAGKDIRAQLQIAMSEFSGTQRCYDALAEIHTLNGQGLDPRHQSIIETLLADIQPILAQQNELRQNISVISHQLSVQIQEEQQTERLRLDGQKRLALEAAAVPFAALGAQEFSGSARGIRIEQPVRQRYQPMMTLQNGYGLTRALSQTGQPPRPATPPTDTVIEITDAEDVD